jgi:hypothetical protein
MTTTAETFKVTELAAARKQRRQPQRRNGKVHTVTPDPHIWKEALRLAGGDAKRLRVVSPAEVVVLNNPGAKLPQRSPRVRRLAYAIGELTGCPPHTAGTLAELVWAKTTSHRREAEEGK